MRRSHSRSARALVATVCVAVWAGVAVPAFADAAFASVFGNDMVLQRDAPLPVWGRADPGRSVTVTLAGHTKKARADVHGRWRVLFDPLPAGGPHALRLSAGSRDHVQLDGVLVGDVWLCSGQSNMRLAMAWVADAQAEIAAAEHPRLRLFQVPTKIAVEPQEAVEARWVACTPRTVRGFSATAYYFGRELQRVLKVPVGLMLASADGTVAEAWTRREGLDAERTLAPMLQRWDKLVEAFEEGRSKLDMRRSGNRPGVLWNGMIAPLAGFAIRGVAWYQGESNAPRAAQYRTLFPALIRDWRAQWKAPDLPFLFAQIASYGPLATEPTEDAWAELRDAQLHTLRSIPGTGMAVLIDVGDAGNIHPKDKQSVGRRLAAWALANVHGIEQPYSGPLYEKMTRRGSEAVIAFSHVDGGLETHDGRPVRGFTVADEDHHWHLASARIEGDVVVVSSETVRRPVAVRYAWAKNPDANLANGAGFPASPFRTDDFELTTAGR